MTPIRTNMHQASTRFVVRVATGVTLSKKSSGKAFGEGPHACQETHQFQCKCQCQRQRQYMCQFQCQCQSQCQYGPGNLSQGTFIPSELSQTRLRRQLNKRPICIQTFQGALPIGRGQKFSKLGSCCGVKATASHAAAMVAFISGCRLAAWIDTNRTTARVAVWACCIPRKARCNKRATTLPLVQAARGTA
jgi:hypothetical protein